MQKIIKDFAEKIAEGTIEIYNEFSLQNELGIFLRGQSTFSNMKVQFERPVSFFGSDEDFIKREIDIAIYSEDEEGNQVKEAILELKFPRKGQYPEQMFSFCKSICFCEQLKKSGFKAAYVLVFVDDKLFYEGANQGIYQFFRSPQNELHGVIQKPTGSHDDSISIDGHHLISWNAVKDELKYALVEV
ncbi:MAG: hypothetical protein WCL34_10215 [Methylococcaceae bacterium]